MAEIEAASPPAPSAPNTKKRKRSGEDEQQTAQRAAANAAAHTRTMAACDACRVSKTRCDAARPVCAKCQKRGRTCVYPDKDPSTMLVMALFSPCGQMLMNGMADSRSGARRSSARLRIKGICCRRLCRRQEITLFINRRTQRRTIHRCRLLRMMTLRQCRGRMCDGRPSPDRTRSCSGPCSHARSQCRLCLSRLSSQSPTTGLWVLTYMRPATREKC